MADVLMPLVLLSRMRATLNGTKESHESGGLLLGLRKSGAIQIESLTFPKRWDVASPTLFQRSNRGHSYSALKEWKRSGEVMDWVGEWHTHPFGSPAPSKTDCDTWQHLAVHTRAQMCFIILGRTENYFGLQSPQSDSLQPLKIIEQTGMHLLFGGVSA